jgi:hypothetical protein
MLISLGIVLLRTQKLDSTLADSNVLDSKSWHRIVRECKLLSSSCGLSNDLSEYVQGLLMDSRPR